MQVGRRARVAGGHKEYVRRHGGANGNGGKRRRSAAREEKAIETATRRAGKRACEEG